MRLPIQQPVIIPADPSAKDLVGVNPLESLKADERLALYDGRSDNRANMIRVAAKLQRNEVTCLLVDRSAGIIRSALDEHRGLGKRQAIESDRIETGASKEKSTASGEHKGSGRDRRCL